MISANFGVYCQQIQVSPSWELELRPLGVATGNALSVTRSEDTYEKTPPVGRRQPMTSLPACHNISAAGRKHHQLLRYLTPDDTHDCCVFCLGMEHARDVLEGAVCVHCERLSMRKLSSRLSLFSRKEGQPSASRDSRPTVAEARRRMKSWGSQLVVADKLERDRPLFARRPRTRVSCWIVMMRSF